MARLSSLRASRARLRRAAVRHGTIVWVCASALFALLLIGLGRSPAQLPATFGAADCSRVEVAVAGLGPLVGIEDLALLQDGRLILSAHDRRAPGTEPGGLYVARLVDLRTGQPLPATPLPGAAEAVIRLRPHGFAVDAAARRLAFVNRPDDGVAELVWGELDEGRFVPLGQVTSPNLCRANDLTFAGERLYVTIDRRHCGTSLIDLLPLVRTGTVLRVDLRSGRLDPLGERSAFANGIAEVEGGIAVAETRTSRIAFVGSDRVLPLPGGPDNLTTTEYGRLVAPLHPHLLRYALYHGGYTGHAPTRIVQADLATAEIEVLMDDPGGEIFSGASVAVMAGGRLIAGSAFDRGLLLCEAPK